MKKYRGTILFSAAALAVALPLTEIGFLGMQTLLPATMGAIVGWCFTDKSLITRSVLLFGVVLGVALARLCWIVMLLDGGDWRLDGEWNLEVMSIMFQLFFAVVGYSVTSRVHRSKAGVLSQ